MLRYLRRGQVLSMFTSTSTEAETLEMEALPRARIVGRPLHSVNIPEGSLLARSHAAIPSPFRVAIR